MKYRPDIDGLRAIAIVPVLAFHAGIDVIKGGFTGVDVFFVISGYLITRILVEEIEAGRLSIWGFYKRRVLRILPALMVVLAATLAVAWLLFLPNELRNTGTAAAAAGFSVSNVLFWIDSGYFSSAAERNPLLHTWSLSLEEQFYLVFPFFLLIVHRLWPTRLRTAIIAVIAISFGLNIIFIELAPEAAFYLLPMRAWELGAGALVALGGFPHLAPKRAHLAAAVGLVLVLLGFLVIDANDNFPGWGALLPVVGTVLLIAYGATGPTSRLTSLPPMIAVGRISYSLYLWHWPIIVFYRIRVGEIETAFDFATVFGLSFALAIVSYSFVEKPFRGASWRALRTARVNLAGLACAACIALGGSATAALAPNVAIFPREVSRIANYTDYASSAEAVYQKGDGRICFLERKTSLAFDRAGCLSPDPGKPDYLIIGDSHANHIWRALTLTFPKTNFLQATAAGCRPLLNGDGVATCTQLMRYVMNEYLRDHELAGIILAGRWRENELDALVETVNHLKTRVSEVVVLGPTVEYEQALPVLAAYARHHDSDSAVLKALDETRGRLSERMAELLRDATYVPLIPLICPGASCTTTTQAGVPLQWDYGHYTLPGSIHVVRQIARIWRPMGSR